MVETLTREDVLAAWGKPAEEVADELGRFSETARVLSSSRPRLIDSHPQQWVGLFDGNVEIVSDSLSGVIHEIEEKGYPREEVLVRFIDRNEKTLIL